MSDETRRPDEAHNEEEGAPVTNDAAGEATTNEPSVETDAAEDTNRVETGDAGHTAGSAGTGVGVLADSAQKSRLMWAGGIIIALFALVAGLSYAGVVDLGVLERLSLTADSDEAVAIVNGESISRERYDDQVEQTRQVFAAFGQSAEGNPALEAELQSRVLEDLINSTLLLQHAQDAGITVSDEEVEEQVQATIEQVGGQEQFESQLASIGLSEAELRDNVREQLTVQAYLDQETDIDNVDVTDEEIQEFYDTAVAGMEDAPPLEEVRENIESQVAQQKSSEILDSFIAQLRAEADVEVLYEVQQPDMSQFGTPPPPAPGDMPQGEAQGGAPAPAPAQ